MGQYCMGTGPQRFSPPHLAVFLKMLWESGFFTSPSQWGWFWIAAIGEIVLKPFALYSATYNPSGPFVQPSLMFSLSESQVEQSITKYNQSLGPSDFYLARAGRPSLIVNTNLLEDYKKEDSPPNSGAGDAGCDQRSGSKSGRHGEGRRRCGVVRVHVHVEWRRRSERDGVNRHQPELFVVRYRRVFQRLLRGAPIAVH